MPPKILGHGPPMPAAEWREAAGRETRGTCVVNASGHLRPALGEMGAVAGADADASWRTGGPFTPSGFPFPRELEHQNMPQLPL